MKNTIMLSASLTFFITSATAQIPNADFENWTTTGSYSTPDGWDNFNSMTDPNSIYTCERGTTGAPHGSLYLKLTTKIVGSSAVPGLAQTGKYDIATKKPISGFAYTGRPLSLTGKWQYITNGPDTGRVGGFLSKWNMATGTREIVAEFQQDFTGIQVSWTSFTVPLTYMSGATPDSAVIAFVSSNKTATSGTYVYVDSLNFAGTAAGINTTANTKYNVVLFPNPATDNLTIDFGTAIAVDVTLWVMDMYGRVITEVAYDPGKRVYSLALNNVSPGVYFVKLQSGEDVQTHRVVIQ